MIWCASVPLWPGVMSSSCENSLTATAVNILPPPADPCWYLYMVRLPNNALYTGITTDVGRRFKQHQSGKGAKALRGKGELRLAFSTEVGDHGRALRLEYRVKRLRKSQKERLVAGEIAFEDLFSDLQTQAITDG